MNNDAIKKHLELVWDEFSVEYPDLARFKNEVYFAGGCIRSLAEYNVPKDYDFFFKDSVTMKAFVLTTYEKSLGKTTMNSRSFHVKGKDLQFVVIDCNNPRDEVGSFDFTFNQNYYNLQTHELYIKDIEAIKDGQLIFNFECRNPFDTFFRLFKFVERGYKLPDQDCLDRIAVRMSRLEPIVTQQDFLDSTKRCSSACIEYGRLDFLE